MSARRVGDGFVLKWDYAGHGKYQVALRRYQPAETPIPAEYLGEGSNVITLRAAQPADVAGTHEYRLSLVSGQPVIPSDEQIVRHDRPGLIAAWQTDAGYVLEWDTPAGGV